MRRGRPDDDVDLREGPIEVILNEAANLLCLAVVGVVITGRQCIGADHDAALHFLAKAFAACSLVHVFEIDRVFAAITIAHAIEAGEVGRCFGRGYNVIG